MATAKLYVGTYKKYNEGSLEGEWVDLSDYSDKDDFLEYCAELHKDEEDPELMFQDSDFDGVPNELYSESDVNEQLFVWLDQTADFDDERLEALEDWMNNESGRFDDVEDSIDKFQSAYQGKFKDAEDFAYDYCENTGMLSEVPESIKRYFDYEAFGRDLMLDGYWMSENGYVFSDNY